MASGRSGLWENHEVHKHLATPKWMSSQVGSSQLSRWFKLGAQPRPPPQPGLPLPSEASEKREVCREQRKGWE